MNIRTTDEIRTQIENLRRYENELFVKLHTPSRKDDLLKITKQYQAEHKLIQYIINALGRLYEIRVKIESLEQQK